MCVGDKVQTILAHLSNTTDFVAGAVEYKSVAKANRLARRMSYMQLGLTS